MSDSQLGIFGDSKTDEDTKLNQMAAFYRKLPINYVGNKKKLFPHIWNLLRENNVAPTEVLDLFGGSGVVSLSFAMMGRRVLYNDILFSSAIRACFMLNPKFPRPLSNEEILTLCSRKPSKEANFVSSNFTSFFSPEECRFLDDYRQNVAEIYGSNVAVSMGFSRDQTQRWYGTQTFSPDVEKKTDIDAVKAAFALMAIINLVNARCFLGGRYYKGQTLAKLEHRLAHQKNNDRPAPKGRAPADGLEDLYGHTPTEYIALATEEKRGRQLFDDPLSDMGLDAIYKAFESSICSDVVPVSILSGDAEELLSASLADIDLIYFDPPYGGDSSDYVSLYRFIEEYVLASHIDQDTLASGKKFKGPKEYMANFQKILCLAQETKYWLLSFNATSFAPIQDIVGVIKTFKHDVVLKPIVYSYNYRKGKKEVSPGSYLSPDFSINSKGHSFVNQDQEYLILAK